MRLYNTLGRDIQEFVPINEKEIKMYVCGPTVYDLIHIGNARPIVIFDCLRRYLEFLGYNVRYVQNFTDIDDKLIKRAKDENSTVECLSRKYIKEYNVDVEKLGVKKPTVSPKVTENIDLIIDIVDRLIKKKSAYVVEGNVYFDVSSFKDYGKLSNMPLLELEEGIFVDCSELKRQKLDFVLWKASKEGEPFWRAPWGEGRPGWHIECSAMALHFLGSKIDIHCGGQDLIFPHHENEIAQSECATGEKFANYWLHNGHVKVDGQKMSKSLGNFFTVRDLGEKYGYETVRYFIIQSHYKMPINFTKDSMLQSKASLQRIYNFKDALNQYIKDCTCIKDMVDVQNDIKIYKKKLKDALDEDFNTALAVSVVFEYIRQVNIYIKELYITKDSALALRETFDEFMDIFGIARGGKDYNIPEDVLVAFEKRKIARKNKDYVLADKLRQEIEAKGYLVKETKTGSYIYLKE